MALTKLKIDTLREPGRYGDGGGLWLQVTQSKTKSWLFRYQMAGKARHMGLGAAELVSLADARELAHTARQQVRKGIDPIAAREAERARNRLAQVTRMTFRQACEETIAAREGGWDNRESSKQWRSTLVRFAYPLLADLSVDDVDAGLVADVLKPIWTAKPTTAERLRRRIEAAFNYAIARGRCRGANPARFKENLEHLLPDNSKPAANHPALPYADVPAFMRELRQRSGTTARAFEFCVLTATRTKETLGARWDEIEGECWTIPAARMKGRKGWRKEHRVPLSTAALALLAGLPRNGEFVFAGARGALHAKALGELLRSMGIAATVHGFRSSFRTWAAERTAYPSEIAEAALAHVVGRKIERVYSRTDFLEKRQRLMEDWGRHCDMSVSMTARIIPIGAQAIEHR